MTTIDDGQRLTIPKAWTVWTHNGVRYHRTNGLIVVTWNERLWWFDYTKYLWRETDGTV